MKYFVTAALAVALMGAAATAQADNPPDKHEHAAPAARAAPHAAAARTRAPAAANRGARVNTEQRDVNREASRVNTERQNVGRAATRVNAERQNVGQAATRVRSQERAATHALRASDRGRVAYNPSVYRQQFTATRRFQYSGPGYPGGWYARSWSYGNVLPVGWYAPQFYLNYGLYGLLGPPIGCEWVREGPDAVLVNIYTGQVLSVDRCVFY